MPDYWLMMLAAKNSWWYVPIAVAMGIPLYFPHAIGIIPIIEALLSKHSSGYCIGIYDGNHRHLAARNNYIT